MRNAVRVLLFSALTLLAAGSVVYHRGSQLNVGVPEELIWENAPGDLWLYAGGLMMLISGSLGVAAVRIWIGNRREARASLRGV